MPPPTPRTRSSVPARTPSTRTATPALPSSRRQAAADASYEVLGPGGDGAGQADAVGGYRGRAGRDVGPVQYTVSAAADDVVTLHIAVHGLPPEERQPYSGAAEA